MLSSLPLVERKQACLAPSSSRNKFSFLFGFCPCTLGQQQGLTEITEKVIIVGKWLQRIAVIFFELNMLYEKIKKTDFLPTFSVISYAAYGSVYVCVALSWLWLVEGQRPTRWDIIGVVISLIGMSIIIIGRQRN